MRSAGITAVVLLAHFQADQEFSKTSHPALWKGLDWLKSLQKPTGAIFHPQEGNSNYVTSVSVLAMVLSGDGAYKGTVDLAVKFLIDTQSTDKTYEGGFGYQDKAKTKEKPYADIVNTEFALEALNRAGLDPSHPAWERAVTYLQRSQHNSEYNEASWVSDIGDYRGGFVYHPGGESKAGSGPDVEGKDVSLPYGSVTYAGIKSMIYAHLDRDDPRVMAAVDWIKRNWTLEENPGFDVKRDKKLGKQGYYYYFMTFAKALHALGEDEITDNGFVKHNWRKELTARVVSLQASDGSWVNSDNDRWFESHKPLATSYAIIALSYALMKN
jgi:squalene-hopene/tetraprenyl-beta-curcumene cyclase